MLPMISVVVPTRDRPALLHRAVTSILGQDYEGVIECIVVFDGTDPHVLDVPTGDTRRLRTAVNNRTPGLAGNRNTGYLLAEGEFVCACDDDDEWLPGKLAAQVDLFRRYPDTSLSATGIVVHFEGRDIPRRASPEPLHLADFLRDRRMEVHPSTYMTRRDAVVAGFGLVDEEIPGGYAEDYEWLLRAARTGPVRCVPQNLVRVHWHNASFFTSRWKTIDEALVWLLEKVPEFQDEPRGLGRIQGQLAFANAAMGERRRALGYARRALRHRPTNRQAWASLPVAGRLITADRVVELGRRFGRGI